MILESKAHVRAEADGGLGRCSFGGADFLEFQ